MYVYIYIYTQHIYIYIYTHIHISLSLCLSVFLSPMPSVGAKYGTPEIRIVKSIGNFQSKFTWESDKPLEHAI